MKRYFTFVMAIALLIGTILAWVGQMRLSEFRNYHSSIAQNTTTGIAHEISRSVDEKNRLVELFAREQQVLIEQLLQNGYGSDAYNQFKSRLNQYFPDYFTFTIASPEGIPYLEDFDGLIGEQCKEELKQFSLGNPQAPHIHPTPELYHYDIMTRIDTPSFNGVLFVSFDANKLRYILANGQAPGHRSLLINQQQQMLIEVTTEGARNKLIRSDFHLSPREIKRILDSKEVLNTRWHAVDLYEPYLFNNYLEQIIQQSIIIFMVYLVLASITLNRIRRIEELRNKAEEHKDEFLSIVSHELRTPLTSIQGALSLVANNKVGEIEDKARRFIEIALSNSERLNYLVDDLLDVQKIESGMMEFTMAPVKIGALVESCVHSQAEYARRFDASFKLTGAETDTLVLVDKERISQAIINLLSNAVKYGAEKDTILIHVETMNHHVKVGVMDHGQGLQERDREKIFNKFVQIDASATRQAGGTGLGLNIVKLIVEKHHGQVDFHISPQGTTFYIELPIYHHK